MKKITRTVRRTGKPAVNDAADVTEIVTETDGENPDKLAKIIAALADADGGENWTCDVYVVEPKTGSEFIFRCDTADLPILKERVRDEYGSGHYRVIVKEGTIIRHCANFRVRSLARPVQPLAQVPTAPANDGTLAILNALKEQNALLLAMMQRQQQQPAPLDPFAQMKTLVETMASLRSITGDAAGTSATSHILEGVKLAQTLQSGDKETNLFDLVQVALTSPLVGKLLQPPPLPAASAGRIAPPPPQAPQPQPEANAQQAMIVAQLRFLAERAAQGCDPDTYAEMLADVVPEPVLAALLAQGDPVAQFAAVVPEIAQHREWFEALLDGCRQIMADDSGQPGTEGDETLAAGPPANEIQSAARSGGRAGNAQADAPQGARR